MSIGQIGKYELIRHLGNGAFGDVFLAHDHALNTEKAIKVLNAPYPNEVMEKLEEAQILHKCKHKNIVRINEANVFQINATSHVVIDMEYLPKGSFENAIETSSVSIHSVLRIIIDCLFGLEHAHINGILHRDVKPANILLCNSGAKLSDFGLATVLGLQTTGSPKGYTTHLPPEYFVYKATTVLTDIYAVGITLFRACNYISDWYGSIRRLHNPDELIYSGKLINTLGFAPFIPQKLKRIINKACASDPSQRYQSAAEFRQALEKLSPRIDWIPAAQSSFNGACVQSGALFSIEISTTKTAFNIELKKNGRRQVADCASFSDLNAAYQYLYSYVSSSLFW